MTTNTAADADRWLRHFHAADGRAPRLVCFPHAGGSAPYFFPVSQALSPGIEVVAVQYPGRQERLREPQIDTLLEVADRIAAALSGSMKRPTAFLGHSMGAVIAFEVARRLEQGGAGPTHLFASGRRAPSTRRQEEVHRYDDAAFLAELSALGGTDPRVLADPELLEMVLPATRADYRAIETYVCPPGPMLSCPVTALTGDGDSRVTPEEADAWSAHTTGAFDLRVFPGGHFFLEEHRAAVFDLIRGALTGAANPG